MALSLTLDPKTYKPQTSVVGDNTYDSYFDEAAIQTGVPKNLIKAVAHRETVAPNPQRAPKQARIRADAQAPTSTAYGPMQLLAGTAAEVGVDPFDVRQNILGGAKYLKKQMDRFGDVDKALTAYFKGPGAVEKYGQYVPGEEGGATAEDYVRGTRAWEQVFNEQARSNLKSLKLTLPIEGRSEAREAPEVAGAPTAPEGKEPAIAAGSAPSQAGVRQATQEDLAQVSDAEWGQIMQRGVLGVEPSKPTAAPTRQMAEDYQEAMSTTPETALAQASQEEITQALQKGPAQYETQESDVVTAAQIVNTTRDPVVRAAFLAGMPQEQQEALLAQIPEESREKVQSNLARVKQDAAGPALGYAAIKSSPIWALVPKKSREYADAAMAQNPTAATLGTIMGTVTQAVSAGGAIGGTTKYKAALNAAKGIKSKPARIAAVKALQGIQRGLASGGVTGTQQAIAVAQGHQSLSEAIKTTVAATAGAGASPIPEGVSKVLPAGTKIAGELATQIGADVAASYLIDKFLGREHTDEERVDIFGVKVPKEYLVSAAMAAPWAIGDVGSDIYSYSPEAKFTKQVASGEPVGRTTGEIESEATIRDNYTDKLLAEQDQKLQRVEATDKPKEIEVEGVSNREARRSEVERGLVSDVEDNEIIAGIREKYGDQVPTKAVVAKDFGISREEAGRVLKRLYGGEYKPTLFGVGEPEGEITTKSLTDVEEPGTLRGEEPANVESAETRPAASEALQEADRGEVVPPRAEPEPGRAEAGEGSGAEPTRRYVFGDKPPEAESRISETLPEGLEGKAEPLDPEARARLEAKAAQLEEVEPLPPEALETIRDHDTIDQQIAAQERAIGSPEQPEPTRTRPSATEPDAEPELVTSARKRIAQSERQIKLRSGPPLDEMRDYAIVGAYKMYRGVKRFSEWSAQMVQEFGEGIRDALRDIYKTSIRMLRSESGAFKVPGGDETQKQRIARTTGMKKDEDIKNLRYAFRKVQRYSAQAYKSGRTAARADMYAALQAKGAQVEDMKRSALNYLKDRGLPTTERARLLAKAANITTQGDFRKFISAADKTETVVERKGLETQLKKTMEVASKTRLRPEYEQKIGPILESIDPKKMTATTEQRLTKLKQLQGTDVWEQMPERVRNSITRLEKTPVAEMSNEDIENVTDGLNQLLKQNALKNKLKVGGKWRNVEDIEAQGRKNIENSPSAKKRKWTPGATPDEKEPNLLQKGLSSVAGKEAETPETIAERVDGKDIDDPQSVVGKATYGEMDQARTEQLQDMQGEEDLFVDFVTKNKLNLQNMSHLLGSKYDKVKVAISTPDAGSVEMTPGHRISLYLHSLNPHNYRSIVHQDGIVFDSAIKKAPTQLSSDDVEAVIASMPPQELAIAEYMRDAIGTRNRQRMNETSVEWNGYEIAKVDNYWRLMRKDVMRKYLDGKMGPTDFRGFMNQMLENTGALKERKAGARGTVVVEDAFKSFFDTMQLGATYKAYAGRLRTAKQVLQDLKPSFRDNGFLEEHRQLSNFISDLEGSVTQQQMTNAERIARHFVSRATTSVLGANPFVILKQFPTYFGAITEMDAKSLGQGLAVAPGSAESKKIVGAIRKNSAQIWARIQKQHISTELGEKSSLHELQRFYSTGKKEPGDVATRGIGGADTMVMVRLWKAAESKVRADNPNLKGQEFDQRVASLAEKVIRRTQPTYDPKDRSAVGRNRTFWNRLATPFTSVPNKLLQMYKRAGLRRMREPDKKKAWVQYGKDVTAIWLSSAVSMTLIEELRDKAFDRDTDWTDRLTRLIRYTFPVYYAAPLIGISNDLIKTVAGTKDWGRSDYDFASRNLLQSYMDALAESAQELAKVPKDKPLETGDFDRLIRGTERLIDFGTQTWKGVSISNLRRYGYDMPKSVARQVIDGIQGGNEGQDLLDEVGYKPRTPKTMTVGGQKYIIKAKTRKKIQDAADSVFSDFARSDLNIAALPENKDERKKQVAELYRTALDVAKKAYVGPEDLVKTE